MAVEARSIGQEFIDRDKQRLTTAWKGLVDASALDRTRLRTAKRGQEEGGLVCYEIACGQDS